MSKKENDTIKLPDKNPTREAVRAEQGFNKQLRGKKLGKVNMNRMVQDWKDFVDNLKKNKRYDIKRERVFPFMLEDIKNLPEEVLENPVINVQGFKINLVDFRENFDKALKELKKLIERKRTLDKDLKKIFMEKIKEFKVDKNQQYFLDAMVNTYLTSLKTRYDMLLFNQQELKNNASVHYDSGVMILRWLSHVTRFKVRATGGSK